MTREEQKHIDYISRIRKELLSIENNAKDIDGLTESQWVAIRAAHRLLGEYIEKEQESINLHDKIEELCSKYPINKYSMSDEELSAYHQGIHLGATKIAEYLSEQKPAEWSDTDNIGWDEAFACATRAEKSAKNEEELQNAIIAEKWLKEIKFKYCVHPVKQECSEEEIKKIRSEEYTKGFNDAAFGGKLKEWSEEDDKPIDCDLSDIDDDFQGLNSEAICKSYKGDCMNCPHNRIKNKSLQSNSEWRHYIWTINMRFDYTALIKYDNTDNYEIVQAGNRPKQEKNGVYILIKDIKPRPHWKPSEEQMEAFSSYIKDFQEKAEAAVGGWNNFDVMIRLYEQLKKL